MKRNIICAAMLLVAGSLMAADKDDLSAAIAKLAAADSYSWKSTSSNAAPAGGGGGGQRRGGGFGGGAVDGKTQKDGLLYVSMPGRGGGDPTQAFLQGTKGAISTEDGWVSLADATKDDGGGGFNAARFTAMRVQQLKAPAAEAKDLLDKTKSLAMADGAYSGDLTDDAVKAMGSTFRMPGGDAPDITNPKGSVKFWVKDGVLTKYEYNVQYHMAMGDREFDRNTTTTVDIKDIGTTKIEVPDDAKKKI